ncbi:MAG: LysE family translocator [Burkholderiaceae bacterium]|jgi:threonine/homoserine/homoserine lactone efflux protein|nr:LysE family translocator [Burkholderiaceae bacterium]
MNAMETSTVSTFIAMAGFALATSASPGPVNIISAMSGAKFGVSRTTPYILGATVGFVSILASTGLGFSFVMTRFPFIVQILAILGSIYMLYLAYKLTRASMTGIEEFEKQSPPNMVAGVFAQYINPKAWIVAISAISIYVSTSQRYAATLTVFCCIFFVICFPSLLIWSIMGASLSKKLGGIRLFNISMALLLAVSIAVFLVEFFRGT